ncbi:MAG TPA: lipoate--protein ligase family protein [Acidimicrobiales bacterium]|nr:lipoate--protein ligase family protein [Acidimicrobiales bacterium]
MTATWRLLADDGVGAAEGLAFDEAMMAGYARDAAPRPPTLRLYTYADHAALVGRYQHLEAEVDLDACRLLGVEVNRRPTGGGAIIMGRSQLGVAVATRAPAAERPRELLERFSRGIIAGLRRLGLDAGFRGKNDLEVGGRKVAGLGLYLDGAGALLFHASILAGLDVETMLAVLKVPAAKLGDKAVALVSERVTTVSRETGKDLDGPALREAVADGVAEAVGAELAPGVAEEEERRLARRLVATKYSTAEWLAQRSPQLDATATSVFKSSAGLVRVYLSLQGETIKSVLFTGDLNDLPPALVRLEAALTWKRLEPRTLSRLVASCLDGETESAGLDPAALVDALIEAASRAAAREVAAPNRVGSCYFPEAVTPR